MYWFLALYIYIGTFVLIVNPTAVDVVTIERDWTSMHYIAKEQKGTCSSSSPASVYTLTAFIRLLWCSSQQHQLEPVATSHHKSPEAGFHQFLPTVSISGPCPPQRQTASRKKSSKFLGSIEQAESLFEMVLWTSSCGREANVREDTFFLVFLSMNG